LKNSIIDLKREYGFKTIKNQLLTNNGTRQRALLSSSHPPSVVASTIAVIDVLEKEPKHVKTLEKHKLFQKAVDDLGFDTDMSQTPIIPIIVGESHIAKMLANKL
jgi:glycine C-acetyltransferase